jgi:hypothetical protein
MEFSFFSTDRGLVYSAELMTIFYYLRFETPKPGEPGPRTYIPQEQGGPVLPQALSSFYVASYDSQGYGGGILTRLHAVFLSALFGVRNLVRLLQ